MSNPSPVTPLPGSVMNRIAAFRGGEVPVSEPAVGREPVALDPRYVESALEAALSPDAPVRLAAEAQLAAWEHSAFDDVAPLCGFFMSLAQNFELAATDSPSRLASGPRLLGAVLLKNALGRACRRDRSRGVVVVVVGPDDAQPATERVAERQCLVERDAC